MHINIHFDTPSFAYFYIDAFIVYYICTVIKVENMLFSEYK